MLKVVRIFIISMVILFCASCAYIYKPSFIQDRNKEYLSAKSIPPLRIPPGLSSDSFHNYYPIPTRCYPEQAKQVDVTPPGLE